MNLCSTSLLEYTTIRLANYTQLCLWAWVDVMQPEEASRLSRKLCPGCTCYTHDPVRLILDLRGHVGCPDEYCSFGNPSIISSITGTATTGVMIGRELDGLGWSLQHKTAVFIAPIWWIGSMAPTTPEHRRKQTETYWAVRQGATDLPLETFKLTWLV